MDDVKTNLDIFFKESNILGKKFPFEARVSFSLLKNILPLEKCVFYLIQNFPDL